MVIKLIAILLLIAIRIIALDFHLRMRGTSRFGSNLRVGTITICCLDKFMCRIDHGNSPQLKKLSIREFIGELSPGQQLCNIAGKNS